jgi:predicted Zn-dependent protease
VYLLPLDDFSTDFTVWLSRVLSDELKICVKSSLAMGSEGLAPFTGTNQYPAEDIVTAAADVIARLNENDPKTCYVIITNKDINERSRNFRFLFAWHETPKKVSVVSAARMVFGSQGMPVSNEIIFSRIYKMTKRAIGEQYFGLARSSNIRDVMYSPIMGLDDLDQIGTDYLRLNSGPK